jgi:hypothetical protein
MTSVPSFRGDPKLTNAIAPDEALAQRAMHVTGVRGGGNAHEARTAKNMTDVDYKDALTICPWCLRVRFVYRRGLDSERELRNRLWEIGRPGASRRQENEGLRRQVAKATERSGSRGVGQSWMGVSRLTSQRFGGRGDVGGTEWKRRDLGEGEAFRVVRGGRVVGVTARRSR